MKKTLLATLLLAIAPAVFAQDLIINAAEFGIGKFHRQDNKVHKYDAKNAWTPFILPDSITVRKLYVQKNSETNYTVFFTNLDELVAKVIDLSKTTGKKVKVFNLNAHGLPGGMWFPKDAKTMNSGECSSWRSTADNSDDVNYDQYYSAVSKEEVLSFNRMSNASNIPSYECLTGLNEWTAVVAARPEIKNVFVADAQIHMLSCLVGLGTLGDRYTQGMAKLLLAKGKVQTSIKFGLGDWSMPQGMGFWGFMNDTQFDNDEARYPVDREDREIMQKGDIRVATVDTVGVKSGLIQGVDYMLLTIDNRAVKAAKATSPMKMNLPAPASVRVPGTGVTINLK